MLAMLSSSCRNRQSPKFNGLTSTPLLYWMDRRRKKVQWPIEMFEASKPCVVCDDLLTQCKQNGSTHMIIHRSTASR